MHIAELKMDEVIALDLSSPPQLLLLLRRRSTNKTERAVEMDIDDEWRSRT